MRPGRNSTVEKAAYIKISKPLGHKDKSTRELPKSENKASENKAQPHSIRPFMNVF